MNVRKVCLSILSAVSIVSLPFLSYAQEAMVTPNYRQVDVRELVEAIGQITQTNVLIRDDVQGKVTFQSDAPMTLAELRRALIAHLLDLGYEVTDQDGVLLVGPKKP
jgi:type II secretory pathway component GspD/PulD (secretin)